MPELCPCGNSHKIVLVQKFLSGLTSQGRFMKGPCYHLPCSDIHVDNKLSKPMDNNILSVFQIIKLSVPFGNFLHSDIENGPVEIVALPIEHGDFP